MTALAGDDANPGIATFDPDVGADLYTTNGDTNDHMYKSTKTISFTPEGTAAATGSVFAFQDNEADVQAEFERHVQFALDLARSAPDPTHPKSHLGNKPANFVVDKFKRLVRQPADRAGERPPRPGPDRAALPRERRQDADRVHVRVAGRQALRRRGRLLVPPHARAGDRHEARATTWRCGSTPRRRTRRATRSRTTSGPTRARACWCSRSRTTPAIRPCRRTRTRRSRTTSTTTARRWPPTESTYDVYDYDAMGRKAPDALGVLSHYDAVIWETGNDNVTRDVRDSGRLRCTRRGRRSCRCATS